MIVSGSAAAASRWGCWYDARLPAARAGIRRVLKNTPFRATSSGIRPISTLEVMRELGLLDEFCSFRTRIVRSSRRSRRSRRSSGLHASTDHRPFIASMPQWEYSPGFLAGHANIFPAFQLKMEAEVRDPTVETGCGWIGGDDPRRRDQGQGGSGRRCRRTPFHAARAGRPRCPRSRRADGCVWRMRLSRRSGDAGRPSGWGSRWLDLRDAPTAKTTGNAPPRIPAKGGSTRSALAVCRRCARRSRLCSPDGTGSTS